ncbi:MAG: polyphosphate kinase 1 [Chthoniobacterales bacterium]
MTGYLSPSTCYSVVDSSQQQHLFINRGLSWLEFNQRVLDQAFDHKNPLLERLKFLGIVSSNLDEFFEVHVAALKQQQSYRLSIGPDGMLPPEELQALSIRVRRQVEDQYCCWHEHIYPELEKEKIYFCDYPNVPEEEQKYFEKYFQDFIFPMLTPLAIDPSHPFPQLLNLSLNLVVHLEGGGADLAVIELPRALSRVIPFSDTSKGNSSCFVFLESIIKHHVDALFYGVKVLGVYLFRVTRNSNLTIDEEESDNLLHAIEEELRHITHSTPIRLEVETDCPKEISSRLLHLFHLRQNDLYVINGPLSLKQLMPLAIELDRPDLRERRFTPVSVLSQNEDTDIFFHIRKGDILLHHPYDSFQTVADFLGHAAEDPHVLAIKQTLYRTSHDSPLVSSLITAAQNGKQVTVIIELKARFDEAANIKWARMMREAGINVIYGLSGLKTHAKAMLIIRQEGEVIRRYVHLGTGNYHPSTARLYTDLGLFTAREELTSDIAAMFNILTGVSKIPHLNELILAPYEMREKIFLLINREVAHHQAGRPSGIYLKMNSLVEKTTIEALYQASQVGVPIRLLIRGICCLRPGIPSVSENIEVRSIVGRFLEHSRILRFENGGTPEIFLSSADWMPRNLFRRVETLFPLINRGVKAHVQEILDWFWKDNVKARMMNQNGNYHPLMTDEEPFSAQEAFMADARKRREEQKAAVKPKNGNGSW